MRQVIHTLPTGEVKAETFKDATSARIEGPTSARVLTLRNASDATLATFDAARVIKCRRLKPATSYTPHDLTRIGEVIASLAFSLGHDWRGMHTTNNAAIMDHVEGSFGLYQLVIDWAKDFDTAFEAKPDEQKENFLEDIDTFYAVKMAELKTAAGYIEV